MIIMGQATITVKYKDAPKEGKKMWSISDGNQRFLVEPQDAEKLQINSTYALEYKTSEFQGKSYHRITSIKAVGLQAANGHAPSNGSGPEKGMIIKESVALLAAGKTPNQILGWFRSAEEIYHQLKSPAPGEFPDSIVDDAF